MSAASSFDKGREAVCEQRDMVAFVVSSVFWKRRRRVLCPHFIDESLFLRYTDHKKGVMR